MPEFKDRADVEDIAEIIGPDRIRSAAHLARCVRTERRPRFREKPKQQGIPEPHGWREVFRRDFPDAVFLHPESPRYSENWKGLISQDQWFIHEEMKKRGTI